VPLPHPCHAPSCSGASVSSGGGPPLRRRAGWRPGRTLLSRRLVADVATATWLSVEVAVSPFCGMAASSPLRCGSYWSDHQARGPASGRVSCPLLRMGWLAGLDPPLPGLDLAPPLAPPGLVASSSPCYDMVVPRLEVLQPAAWTSLAAGGRFGPARGL
jgi:hypothetical protein